MRTRRVAAVGFGKHIALIVDVTTPGRLRLRAAAAEAATGPTGVIGSSRVHTDARGQTVITAALRTHLGIKADGFVVA